MRYKFALHNSIVSRLSLPFFLAAILKLVKMAKEKVSVVFDRRKKAEQAGVGYVEVQIYLGIFSKYLTNCLSV